MYYPVILAVLILYKFPYLLFNNIYTIMDITLLLKLLKIDSKASFIFNLYMFIPLFILNHIIYYYNLYNFARNFKRPYIQCI